MTGIKLLRLLESVGAVQGSLETCGQLYRDHKAKLMSMLVEYWPATWTQIVA